MVFNKEKKSKLDEIIETQAKALNIDPKTLREMYQGKSCPKYGVEEPLHIRKTRGGKLTVFNISEKFRGEKISIGRKALKEKKQQPRAEDSAVTTAGKQERK